ncbi:hypothetical protein K402DRAFT_391910 [Aulographum hederae CBS 113979]|uniref:DUF3669 domain-containing protein n=1 Tax=Aulographum hederae CBS 113979 TaxID=1176131 RepID=A0A6G1H557_9PEZI|nr:hypothetical protein K402DRAFT_391910 [Aulographum hederae CBS 113979]
MLLRGELSIPKCHWYVASKDHAEWWQLHLNMFRGEYHEVYQARQGDVLCTERIPPISKELRHAIIDKWCPEQLRESAKINETSQDCLIRVYLGKRRFPRSTLPPRMFSLRNFNLCVDMIEELDCNMDEYRAIAETMGQALAHLHWTVGTDARDVEFVLGGARPAAEIPIPFSQLDQATAAQTTWKKATKDGETHSAVRLWLLDFNQCRPISKDVEGIKKAADAVFGNDPYYPRPLCENMTEQGLWNAFQAGYMAAGTWALEGEEHNVQMLPKRCLEAHVL